ncbi:MAG: carbon storage regulator [Planctomycetaceae bacterium]|nr:carbon storage regulator [Planctomycetaceae bacterium]
MLVLTRRSGQKLIISDSITIRVVSIGRGQVRFGIEAPREISVRRIPASAATEAQDDDGIRELLSVTVPNADVMATE